MEILNEGLLSRPLYSLTVTSPENTFKTAVGLFRDSLNEYELFELNKQLGTPNKLAAKILDSRFKITAKLKGREYTHRSPLKYCARFNDIKKILS